jgi:hypothetical protein
MSWDGIEVSSGTGNSTTAKRGSVGRYSSKPDCCFDLGAGCRKQVFKVSGRGSPLPPAPVSEAAEIAKGPHIQGTPALS